MKKIFLYTNIYIALGASLACFATATIFKLPIFLPFFLFIFFATLCTYNMHWYFTPVKIHNQSRENWSIDNKKLLAFICVTSFFIGISILYLYLLQFVLYIFPLVIISILYSAPKIPIRQFQYLKKMVVGKTLYLAIAWTYATVILPMIMQHNNISDTQWQFAFHRFLFILIICGLFDYKDRIEDKDSGIKSILAMASVGIVGIIIQVLLSMSILSNFRLIPSLDTIHIFLNFIPLLLVMIAYKKSIQSNNEVWYYFFLDGLLFVNGAIYAMIVFVSYFF